MPVDDERGRFSRIKSRGHAKSQTAVTAKGGCGPENGVQESLEMLREILVSQRSEHAGIPAEEEKRIEANKQVAQRAQNERNEKYERLQQAFKRMNKWKDEENTEGGGEEQKRVQDEDGSRLMEEVLERHRQQHADARAFVESMLRESREENKEIIEILKRRNPNPPEVRIIALPPSVSFAEDAVKVAVEDIRMKAYDVTGMAKRRP